MCTNDNQQTFLDGDLETKSNFLSYKEISDILKRDIPQHEFIKMWKMIELSLKNAEGVVSVLEGIAYFDDEFIVDNRLFLADIFELAESLSYVLYNDLFSREERDYIFNKAFEETFFKSLDEEAIKVLRSVFDIEDIPLEIRGYEKLYYSFEAIFQKYEILLEKENMLWVDYLKRAEELQASTGRRNYHSGKLVQK